MEALLPRDEIPFLRDSEINYLDSAATTLAPSRVVDAITRYYTGVGASAGRSAHRSAIKAGIILDNARETVARFFNRRPIEVIFTYNATDAINSIAVGLDWQPGDKIVTTLFEHHANLLPWYRLREKFGIEIEIVNPSNGSYFIAEDFEEVLNRGNCRLLAFTHRSNVLGDELPAREIADIARRYGVLTLIDAAQSAPHMAIDLEDVDPDFFVASAHKMLGPKGVGFLIIKENAYEYLRPGRLGGGIVKDVSFSDYKLSGPPGCFEAGTQNIGGIAGAAEALDILSGIGMGEVERHDRELGAYLYEGLSDIGGIKIYGRTDKAGRTGTCSFTIDGITPHVAASLYDSLGRVALRSGHHCALPVTKEYVKSRKGTVRASLYVYNGRSDIDHFLGVTEKIIKKRGISG